MPSWGSTPNALTVPRVTINQKMVCQVNPNSRVAATGAREIHTINGDWSPPE